LIKGDPVGIEEKKAMFADHLAKVTTPALAKLQMQKVEEAAQKQRAENAISDVYAAVEAATDPQTGTGDFATARELAKNDAIPEPDQATLRNYIRTQEAAYTRTTKIQTNQLIKGNLEQKAYQVSLGAVDKQDYEEMLYEARYGKVIKGKVKYVFEDTVSDVPLIDDSDYDELRTLGIKQFQTSQAKGLAEASSYAKGQLVQVSDEASFERLLQNLDKGIYDKAVSQHQVELENWAQFNRAMREWVAEHPDATESEIYLESRRKIAFYRGRTAEEVQKGPPIIPVKPELKKTAEKLGEIPDYTVDLTKPPINANWYFITGPSAAEPTDITIEPETPRYKYTATNPETGERIGSNDGVTWKPIE